MFGYFDNRFMLEFNLGVEYKDRKNLCWIVYDNKFMLRVQLVVDTDHETEKNQVQSQQNFQENSRCRFSESIAWSSLSTSDKHKSPPHCEAGLSILISKYFDTLKCNSNQVYCWFLTMLKGFSDLVGLYCCVLPACGWCEHARTAMQHVYHMRGITRMILKKCRGKRFPPWSCNV